MPAGNDQLVHFWDGMAAHPALAAHPMLGVDDWSRTFIPLSLHGDGVPVTGVGKAWSKGVESYSFTSVLAEGTRTLKHWLIFMSPKSCLCKDSLNVAWKDPWASH